MQIEKFYQRSRLDSKLKEEVVEILLANPLATIKEVADGAGIKFSAARMAIQYLEIPERTAGGAFRRLDEDEIASKATDLFAKGKKWGEVYKEISADPKRIRKICKSLGLKPVRTPRHGTAVEYDYWGCRCDVCRKANYDRCMAVKADMKSRVETDCPHGTMTGYWNWECRCDACVKVGAEVNKMRVTTPVETQKRSGERWTEAEIAALENYDVIARELAMSLGRTTGSVNTRRMMLGIRKTNA